MVRFVCTELKGGSFGARTRHQIVIEWPLDRLARSGIVVRRSHGAQSIWLTVRVARQIRPNWPVYLAHKAPFSGRAIDLFAQIIDRHCHSCLCSSIALVVVSSANRDQWQCLHSSSVLLDCLESQDTSLVSAVRCPRVTQAVCT